MLSITLQESLNKQVKHEAQSSQIYLAMASWSDIQPGLQGVTEFFYQQSEEERMHMLKLVKYINERGGMAIVPSLDQPIITYPSLKKVFEEFFKNEMGVSESINDIVHLALQERDYATHNFLQWYVAEQIEEERLARTLNEKLEMIGEDKSGLYLFDRDIVAYRTGMSKSVSQRH
jgi:ferritin